MFPLLLAMTLGLHAKPCTEGKTKVPALCGTFGVYEDRAARAGRIIQIAFVALRARHLSRRAIVIIAGGPGESAVPYAQGVADGDFTKSAMPLRNRYNILLMDDRGMGGSNGLQCDLTPQSNPAAYFLKIFPLDIVRNCRAKDAATSNLADYNTNYATDDLNDLRAALGYSKLVLYGDSYGTFFSFIYMRRHPISVESAVLNGVDPPGFQPLPGVPLGAQRALDDLIAKCKRNATCNAHFPNLSQDFNALLGRLNKGPVPVTLVLKRGAAPVAVAMSKVVFVDRLRQILYHPQAASYIPYAVDQASRGNTRPLATIINVTAVGLSQDVAMGAFLSYDCAEDIPFHDQREIDDAAAHSFAGDLRINEQRRACAIWDVPAMPTSFNDRVHSTAPILMISGSDDPSTPPQYADDAAEYLPNARIVLVQGAGHASESPCTDKLVVQFVRARSTARLNVNACRATFRVPHFATSMEGFDQ